jgi:hypothetical protein
MRKTYLLATMISAALGLAPLVAHADDAPSTTLGGTGFIDATSLTTQKNGNDIDPSGPGTDVTRFYLTMIHTFNDVWSSNLTTDFNYVSADGETQLFVKNAYVQGKFDNMAVFRLGAAPTTWISFDEGVYGYRFVEKTLIDRLSYGNSADWGANLNGTSSMVNYSVSAVNGGGYKNPTRTKSVDEEGRVAFTPLDGSLIVAVGYYTGDLGQNTYATPAINTFDRTDFLVAWKAAGLTVGAEYFSANNLKQITKVATDKADGYSGFASYDFTPDYSIFARYDDAKLSKTLDPTNKDTYYNAGFAWKSNSGVTWALVYKYEDAKATSGATLNETKTTTFGIFAQVKY